MSEALKQLELATRIQECHDRRVFFFKDAFIPNTLANEIRGIILKIKTRDDTEECYYYDDEECIWKQAECKLKEIAHLYLQDDSSTHRVTETINAIKRSTYFNYEKERPGPHLIPLQNGIFNVETNDVQNYGEALFFTNKLPIKYDPAAEAPAFQKFLNEVLPDFEDTQTVRQIFAYCFYRTYPLQKAFMLTGEGANGKSTLLNVLIAMLGHENVTGLTLQDLSNNDFAASILFEKYANICPDIPASYLLSSGKFKALTGSDMVYANRKHKEGIHFWNAAKLIFSANQLPKTKDETDAFMRRWVILNFPMSFPPDKANTNLTKEITTPEELSGIFNWAIQSLPALLKAGKFVSDRKIEETRELYIRRSNNLAAFAMDCLEAAGGDDFIDKETLYNYYTEYCYKIKASPDNKIAVGRELPRHISVTSSRRKVDDRGQIPVWQGVRYVSPDFEKLTKKPTNDVKLEDFDENKADIS